MTAETNGTRTTRAPVVTVNVAPYQILPGEDVTVTVQASDDDDVSVTLLVDGVEEPLSPNVSGGFVAVVSPSELGVTEVVVTVQDPSGNTTTRTSSIRVIDVSDNTRPVVTLTAPSDDAELVLLHDVVGSVFDDNLYRWTVDMKPTDDRGVRSAYRTVLEGRSNVTGTLGQLDATMLENGRYWLRLRAEDGNGQIGEVQIPVRVAGDAKLGHVRLSFTDLVVADVGIPLAVVRTHDSRNTHYVGDFGYGWDLDIRTGKIQHNRPIGEDILITNPPIRLGGQLVPCSETVEQKFHFTEVRLSANEYYVFKPLLGSLGTLSGSCGGEFAFEYVDGTEPGAELVPMGNRLVRSTPSPINDGSGWTVRSTLTDVSTGLPYDPQNFELRLADGRRYVVNKRDGVVQFEDASGNRVQLTRNGLIHSSGRSIRFERDAQNRIKRIFDGAGREVRYTYDAQGNLTSFVNPLGAVEGTTRYEYRNSRYPHHLTDIVDTRGVRTAALTFENDGRLDEVCDADGVCFNQNYDVAHGTFAALDNLGQSERLIYGSNGDLDRRIDRNGGVHRYAYLGHRLTREEDPAGNITTLTYDASGRPTSRVTPHGTGADDAEYTTEMAWSGADLTSLSMPTGDLSFEYDAQHHRTATRDSSGALVESAEFDSSGRMTSQTTREGVTRFFYLSATSTRPERVESPQGGLFDFEYSASGEVLSARGLLPSGQVVSRRYRRDALGRVLTETFDDVAETSYLYAGDSEDWVRLVAPQGVYERRLSARGRLLSATAPSGDVLERTYDVLGRAVRRREIDGRETVYSFDAEGNVLVMHDLTTGAQTTFTRDAAGRELRIEDERGFAETVEYNGLQVSARVNARGARTEFDAVGLLRSERDALGQVRAQELSSDGRLTRETFTSGTSVWADNYSYETSLLAGTNWVGGPSARRSLHIDASGRSRSMAYDSHGALAAASHLDGSVLHYSYGPHASRMLTVDMESGTVSSGVSNVYGGFAAMASSGGEGALESSSMADELSAYGLTSMTTASGEVTQFAYDSSGEVSEIALPWVSASAGREERSHDVLGRTTSVTLPSGEVVNYTLDSVGRVASRSSDGTDLRTYHYGPGDRLERVVEASGETALGYDGASRLISKRTPVGALTRIGYDAGDRVTSIEAGLESDVSSMRRVEYGYDGNGNLVEVREPDGDVVTLEWDLLDRLVYRRLPNGVETRIEYDGQSHITRMEHRSSSGELLSLRVYERLPTGEVTSVTDELGREVNYEVDDAGRILRALRSNGFAGDGALAANEQAVDRYAYNMDGHRILRARREGSAAESVSSYQHVSGGRLTGTLESGGMGDTLTHDAGGRVTTLSRGAREHRMQYGVRDELLQWTTSNHDTSSAQERWSYRYDGLGSRMESRRELAEGGAFTGTATIRREVTGPGLLASAGLSERSPWAVGYGRAESEPALEVRHAVFDEANNILARFYHDDGEHAYVREMADGTEQYYLRDAVGSVVALVDDAENITARFEYDTFGRVTAGPNVDPGVGGDYRFQGMWLDAGVMQDAAVYGVRARVYDADSGRFFTRDPAEGVQTRPETYSPYAFANGNPTLWRDPSGEVIGLAVFLFVDAEAKQDEAAAKGAAGAALVRNVELTQMVYEARLIRILILAVAATLEEAEAECQDALEEAEQECYRRSRRRGVTRHDYGGVLRDCISIAMAAWGRCLADAKTEFGGRL